MKGAAGGARCQSFQLLWVVLGGLQRFCSGAPRRGASRGQLSPAVVAASAAAPASGHPCFPWSYLPQGRRLECGLSSLQLVIRDATLWASEEAVRQWDPTLRESPSVGDGFQVSGRVLVLLTG